MVWWRVKGAKLAGGLIVLVAALACGLEGDMPEQVEMPDTMAVKRALEAGDVADSMLDTIPGGEMARGDSAAANRLLEGKMPD